MFTDSLLLQNTALAEVVENAAVLSTVGLKGFGNFHEFFLTA